MITLGNVGWGRYNVYAGPWVKGSQHMPEVPVDAPMDEKLLQVITATEGGAFDAINMYDKCIMTCGLIQWCDAGQYSVCDMLGAVESAGGSIEPVREYAAKANWRLARTSGGKMRFFLGTNQVDTITEQRSVYLAGSSGRDGEWNASQKTWARGFAVAMANCFQDRTQIDAQIHFTAERLLWFAGSSGKQALFADTLPVWGTNPILDAARAAYISFAANLPVVADKQLASVLARGHSMSTRIGLIELLKQLTFGPGIALYPTRYNKIRPHLERFFGEDLPDFAKDLQAFQEKQQAETPSYCVGVFRTLGIDPGLATPADLQKALIYLGYDLGPAGADGRIGQLTKTAIINFQLMMKLQPDGVVGKLTRAQIIAEVVRKAT